MNGYGLTGILEEEHEHGLVVYEPSWNRRFRIPNSKINQLERNLGTEWVTVWIDAQYAARHLDLTEYLDDENSDSRR